MRERQTDRQTICFGSRFESFFLVLSDLLSSPLPTLAPFNFFPCSNTASALLPKRRSADLAGVILVVVAMFGPAVVGPPVFDVDDRSILLSPPDSVITNFTSAVFSRLVTHSKGPYFSPTSN